MAILIGQSPFADFTGKSSIVCRFDAYPHGSMCLEFVRTHLLVTQSYEDQFELNTAALEALKNAVSSAAGFEFGVGACRIGGCDLALISQGLLAVNCNLGTGCSVMCWLNQLLALPVA